jgi:pyruvate/2-oxoglutarate dehydrogenase complex dihydrolipoamide dehydrogenase (E3) component
LIGAARAWAEARHAARDFAGPPLAADAPGNFSLMMDRMRRIRSEMSVIDSASRFKGLGVDVFIGDGRFTARDAIAVGHTSLRFRRAVIASGARAAAPPIPGLVDVGYRTNESIFDLTALPPRLAIVGAGPIGCELAQTFARFGSAVTLIDRLPRVMSRDDADAAAIIHDGLVRDGVSMCLGVGIAQVERRGENIVVHTTHDANGARAVECDELLIAAGRAPNVESLGLDVAGVTFDKRGVTVDDRLRTTNANVFACGDVCSLLQFTHAADFQARMVIQNALFFGRAKASNLVTPWVTYTSPELAHVGHTAESAGAAGLAIQTFTVPMHDVDRARLDGTTDGFCRVHVRAGTDTIVGATIVAPNAGDMISEVTLAMTNALGLGAIGKTMHPYPTQGEVLRKVADAWRRTKLTPRVKNLFVRYFRLFR